MINLVDLADGTRLKLAGGIIAEVIENMGDGQWVQVRYLEVPGKPDDVGAEELCHSQDIVAVLPSGD